MAGIRNRKIAYEVWTCVDGRWLIEALESGSDENAISRARQALRSGACEEVKVIRLRSMVTGFTTQKEILHEKRAALKEKPLALSAVPEAVGPCRSLADLYRLESRRTLSLMLRAFLDRFQITPTELLHGYGYVRRLQGELVRDQPLDRRDPARDPQLLEALIVRLRGPDGTLLGGPRTRDALARRMLRQRQAMLRELGMHDAADTLPRRWKPDIPLTERPSPVGDGPT